MLFTGSGKTVYTAATPASGSSSWQQVIPVPDPVNAPWDSPLQMFCDELGSLFAVDGEGVLHRRQYRLSPDALAGRTVLAVPGDTDFGKGWDHWASIFACGLRLFGVDAHGVLQYWTKQTDDPAFGDGSWVVINPGWSRYLRVFAASATSIYAIHSEGALIEFPFTDDGTTVTMLPTQSTVGSGIIGWSGLPCLVEGYGYPQSTAPGEKISFCIATRVSDDPVTEAVPCDIDFVRLCRMRGGVEKDYDVVMQPGPRQLQIEPRDVPDDDVLLARGAQWPESTQLTVPAGWRSGLYAARCTDSAKNRFYIPFIVRNSATRAPFAVLANTNTWNAYNSWSGQGKYVHSFPVPRMIPFERPHPGLTPDVVPPSSTEIRSQSSHLLRAELWVLGWLEELGSPYGYDLYSDWDLHHGFDGLDNADPADRYKALILTVHPEYWTTKMCERAWMYQQQGGSIIYFGGNGVYELVLLGGPRDSMGIFPGVDWSKQPGDITNDQVRLQCLTRVHGYPEFTLLGVGFNNFSNTSVDGQPYLVQSPPVNPMLAGVTPEQDGTIGNSSANDGHLVSGWEVDQRSLPSSNPPGLSPPAACAPRALLGAGTPVASKGGEMLFYETGYGGVVFSGSSLNFGGSLAVDANLQRIVRNVFDECLTR